MKKRALAASAIVLLAIALDLRRPPASQWTTAATLAGIHGYQATLSPVYERIGVRCRFTVTCSHYGEEAIRKYGVAKGGYLAAKRILRCGAWTPMGTVDLVP
jgi:putative membrane protein insertion efficiency factor